MAILLYHQLVRLVVRKGGENVPLVNLSSYGKGENVKKVFVTIPGLAVTTVLILALATVPAASEGQGGGVRGAMIVLPEGASVDDVFDPVTENALQEHGYAYNIKEKIST